MLIQAVSQIGDALTIKVKTAK